jgi:glycosyltransferase involved in cell wall biosynthesis
MNIAIISYHHSESSLVLAKHLSKNNKVHYYFITDRKKKSIYGVGYLSDKNFNIGLNKINLKTEHTLYNYLNNANLKITVIAYPSFGPRYFWLNKLLTIFFLWQIKKNSYDVINLIGQEELLMSFHKGLRSNKVIHSLHEVAKHYSEQDLENNLISLLYKNKIPIIVHSHCSYELLMKQYPFNSKKVFNIPFGLFETYKYFSTGKVNKDENIILFYGFLRPYKGLKTFIKAIQYAREKMPDIRAIIAGAGSDSSLELAANDKTFTVINKLLDNNEIADLNKKAKMIICPYTSASQSGIVTTSNVFDKLIIASDIDGFKEIIINNVTGYLVEVDDHVAIGNHIINLCTNKTLLNNIQKNIKVFYEKGNYNWTTIANNTLNSYQTLLSE